MFRRKEEGLFDSDTDQEEMQDEAVHDEKPAAQQASSSFNASSSSASSAPVATAQQSSQQSTHTPRPSPAPTANSFRPSSASSSAAPLSADLTRNRLPEAKQAAPVTPATFAPPLPISDKSKSGAKRVLTVGNDILLKGEIATCDRLVIEGKVDATLNDVHTVEISECGSFKGSAHIEDAEISGLFEGDLVVRGRLVIYATGKVRGKISYGEIEIERGGELTGEIKIGGAAAVTGNRPISRNATKEDRVAA
ncbi:MAG: polymer-forming cytoskeletal protein [Rickettsiales bacterium]